ncbi:MAG: hypothetical protein HN704_02255 [Bacteroidetes bacterium]|jgi:biotin carboxyl carrier protein|nr:hypothetical protein [Bacteroidota bacterium]MBT6687349.1 hypothetical protein [Bacteroidota bacterium]MBT7144617.1 hypothetical protein [Bacteroidota bacterium]MBT7490409.1 hypothetical protein [Bacteroidota bacterium]
MCTIQAHMSGVFHFTDGSIPKVKIGDNIEIDQTVGFIEAEGEYSPVISSCEGEVKEIKTNENEDIEVKNEIFIIQSEGC